MDRTSPTNPTYDPGGSGCALRFGRYSATSRVNIGRSPISGCNTGCNKALIGATRAKCEVVLRRQGFGGGRVPPSLRALARQVPPSLSRIQAVGKDFNHRWTQINTDGERQACVLPVERPVTKQ